MPKKRFTDEQVAFALRQAEASTSVGEICRKMAVAEATFYRWKKVYAGMGVSEIRRLKQLEEDKSKLKRLAVHPISSDCSSTDVSFTPQLSGLASITPTAWRLTKRT
ncbi:Transposase [Roseivivax halotolerans]|uniref:Transposase n=1 Tax=Roseivivax halotolerans TaxID=93684 RepID=A0A1I6AE60_9RHOB|nr:Transposase [Roseivivax halotolerans]